MVIISVRPSSFHASELTWSNARHCQTKKRVEHSLSDCLVGYEPNVQSYPLPFFSNAMDFTIFASPKKLSITQ